MHVRIQLEEDHRKRQHELEQQVDRLQGQIEAGARERDDKAASVEEQVKALQAQHEEETEVCAFASAPRLACARARVDT